MKAQHLQDIDHIDLELDEIESLVRTNHKRIKPRKRFSRKKSFGVRKKSNSSNDSSNLKIILTVKLFHVALLITITAIIWKDSVLKQVKDEPSLGVTEKSIHHRSKKIS